MNEIVLNINFKNKSISKSNIFLTSGDYNSTKLVFKFDYADGEKYFELKNPSGEVVLYSKIENDEVILVGKTKDGKNASLFKEPGDYIFEISLYNGDSKLTSAYGTIIAEKEQVIIDGTTAEPYLPALENLLNNVKDALNKTENIDITVSKDENKTIIEMTNKDGSKSKVEILDGTDGRTGEQGPIGPEGPQGTPGINGKDGAPGKDGINGTNGEDGFSPTISTEPLENGTKVTIIDKEGSKEFNVLNGENGKDGSKGDKGEPGEKGEQGAKGDTGSIGPEGPQGPKGDPGTTDFNELDNKPDLTLFANKIIVVDEQKSTLELEPNKFYKFGEVKELNLTLNQPSDKTIYNEYMFEFISGETSTTLTLPDTVKWLEEPSIETNKTYQCSILNNIGILLGVSNE